jgi:hypothetical protein
MNLKLDQYEYLYALELEAEKYFAKLNASLAPMGKLGEFPFFMDENEFKKISHTFQADFTSYQPIKGQKVLGMAIGYSRKVTLNGLLVVQPKYSTEPLEWLLKIGKQLRFTTLEHDLDVVMRNLTLTKSYFFETGDHRVESYDISLEETYGKSSL